MKNFAVTGAAGFVAKRHLDAIRATGNRIVAAFDPNDSVGLLDDYGLDIRFFPELERFDRYLEKLRRGPSESRVHFLSVCSPNYVHDAHCRLGLRVGADVICEKPLVVKPWNLDALEQLERETGRRVWNVLQLRTHDKLAALRDRVSSEPVDRKHEVILTYVTARGLWYDVSWKGNVERSGGILANIGVHFFDLLLWIFGAAHGARVHLSERRRAAGFLELEHARVRWFLSVEVGDLPECARAAASTYRSIRVDGDDLEFSDSFTNLHARVYERTIAGRGFGITDARPAIEIAHRLRTMNVSPAGTEAHPFLR
jgi:UDP-N-acetyl-2-amino-2-deoxyglucuronate dehydrogenase